MSSTSDTSVIDEKKGEDTETEDNFGKDIGKFLVSLLVIVAVLCLNFSIGGCVLYSSKIAQSNILPTEKKCMPYDSNGIQKLNEIQTNIFETTIKGQTLSQKISFPLGKNSKFSILDMLRNLKEKPDSGSLMNYLVSIIEGLFAFNFSALNTFFNLLNQHLPEYFIVIFGLVMIMVYSSFLIFINFFYIMYLWFYQMSWFFLVNTNTGETGKPKWQSTFAPVKLFTGCLLVFLFSILFWVGLLVIPFIPMIAPIIVSICIFTIYSYKGVMNNSDVSVSSIIAGVFKYNKITVASIITFFVILCAFANLGGLAGGLSILVVCLIYFGILSIDIFNPINEENLSKVVSYEQATKTCKVSKVLEMKNFLTSMMPWSGGGKKLTREIKKIGTKLK
jgi:hypothetical protein